MPFEVKIAVGGSGEDGIIEFTPAWLTKTTSNGDFGYDPAYMVYCAFVDTDDAATSDADADAKVDSWTDEVVDPGGNNEAIEGTFTVSGLDGGDSVVVEIWVVLKDTISPGTTGNVQTGLLSAFAGRTKINTGNQTVPLLKVQEFLNLSPVVTTQVRDSKKTLDPADDTDVADGATVPIGTEVYDTASMTGATATAGGTVVYRYAFNAANLVCSDHGWLAPGWWHGHEWGVAQLKQGHAEQCGYLRVLGDLLR